MFSVKMSGGNDPCVDSGWGVCGEMLRARMYSQSSVPCAVRSAYDICHVISSGGCCLSVGRRRARHTWGAGCSASLCVDIIVSIT